MVTRGFQLPDRMFVGLVDFKPTTAANADTLGLFRQEPIGSGAVGWMGGRAPDTDSFIAHVRRALGDVGLVLISIEDVAEVATIDAFGTYDRHLLANAKSWRPNTKIGWGTLRFYQSDTLG